MNRNKWQESTVLVFQKQRINSALEMLEKQRKEIIEKLQRNELLPFLKMGQGLPLWLPKGAQQEKIREFFLKHKKSRISSCNYSYWNKDCMFVLSLWKYGRLFNL